jgi:hypothetical protein
MVGARVILESNSGGQSLTTITDEEGRFSFTRVSAGLYTVSASKGGYVFQASGSEVTLRVDAGTPTEQIDLRLEKGGVITGNVIDESGEPVVLATVRAIKLGGSEGRFPAASTRSQLLNATPADLAILYITNGLTGSVRFLPNPNMGVADLLTNSARSNYNSLQVEVRRRLATGLYFQANYTFQKTLADAPGVGQTRFDPLLDNAQPKLKYTRADFDQTHVFNFNGIYELLFGAGKPLLNRGGLIDRLVGGWEITSIIRISTGAPISITDPRGTLNRAGRSGRQTAVSSL